MKINFHTNLRISHFVIKYMENNTSASVRFQVNNSDTYSKKIIRKSIRVYGSVQGVGFRYRTKYAAESLGVTGWVRNELDGSVSMELQGTEEQIDKVFVSVSGGSYISIDRMESHTIPVEEGEYGFNYE